MGWPWDLGRIKAGALLWPQETPIPGRETSVVCCSCRLHEAAQAQRAQMHWPWTLKPCHLLLALAVTHGWSVPVLQWGKEWQFGRAGLTDGFGSCLASPVQLPATVQEPAEPAWSGPSGILQ